MCEGWVILIPETKKLTSIIILFFNIVLPGIGTCSMGCLNKGSIPLFICGICQFLLSLFCFGWIWSIWWGIICVQKSKDEVTIIKLYEDDSNEDNEMTKLVDQSNNQIIIIRDPNKKKNTNENKISFNN